MNERTKGQRGGDKYVRKKEMALPFELVLGNGIATTRHSFSESLALWLKKKRQRSEQAAGYQHTHL